MRLILVFSFALAGLVLSVILACLSIVYLPTFLARKQAHRSTCTMFKPVMVASTEHVDLQRRPWVMVDQHALNPGDRILLKDQNDSRQNGIWVVPASLDREWIRARDLTARQHILDGASIFVHEGSIHAGTTFVLRTMTRGGKPGTAELYFLPILQHLFGPTQLPPHQPLRINHLGLATWESPPRSHDMQEHIPLRLHFVYGLWSRDAPLPEDVQCAIRKWHDINSDCQIRHWNAQKCNELLQAKFPEWVDWYKSTTRPAMKMDLMRWLILYTEGGFVLDADTFPHGDVSFKALLEQSNQPRMLLTTESIISEHEAESLNMFEIRKNHPLLPGPRLSACMIGMGVRHPFVHFMLQHIRKFSAAVKQLDYEVVFATGSDALTHVYKQYGIDFLDAHVLDIHTTSLFMGHHREGSWRTVKK